MFFENNQIAEEGPYTSYIAANSGIDVEFFTVHDNPDDWTFNKNDYKTPLVNLRHLIIYNNYGNKFSNGNSFVQKTKPSILARYVPSNLTNSTELSFDVYRKTPYQKYLEYVCPMGNGHKVYDYNVTSNNYYHYVAVATIKTGDPAEPYKFLRYGQKDTSTGEEQYYHTRFNSWTICDIMEQDANYYYKVGRTWNLGLNLESPDYLQNLSISSWDTQGRYSKTVIGNKNYDSGRFSGLLGNIYEFIEYDFSGAGNAARAKKKPVISYTEKLEYFVGDEFSIQDNSCTEDNWSVEYQYDIETAKLEAWKEFISDGELKLLKDIKGNAWIIQISDNPEYIIDYQSNLKQTRIGFSWKEVADIKNSSIVSFENLDY